MPTSTCSFGLHRRLVTVGHWVAQGACHKGSERGINGGVDVDARHLFSFAHAHCGNRIQFQSPLSRSLLHFEQGAGIDPVSSRARRAPIRVVPRNHHQQLWLICKTCRPSWLSIFFTIYGSATSNRTYYNARCGHSSRPPAGYMLKYCIHSTRISGSSDTHRRASSSELSLLDQNLRSRSNPFICEPEALARQTAYGSMSH